MNELGILKSESLTSDCTLQAQKWNQACCEEYLVNFEAVEAKNFGKVKGCTRRVQVQLC